jgi:hypothetical protein
MTGGLGTLSGMFARSRRDTERLSFLADGCCKHVQVAVDRITHSVERSLNDVSRSINQVVVEASGRGPS